MKKNENLNKWFWKWHFIAGLVSLPFIVLLAITGGIYLFKADYEGPMQKPITEVVVQGKGISFDEQLEIVKENAGQKGKKAPNAMVLPITKNQATEFVSGRFSGKKSFYVDPYKKVVSGVIAPKDSLMFTVRKLHGELLLGKFGTKIVELIASWMIVLLVTGLYVWWPSKGWSVKGFFIPRIKEGKRMFFRDLHAISGFWISGLLLLVLAGGLPWTDIFGDNFKWVQKVTNTGYPATWNGKQVHSVVQKDPLNLDAVVKITEKYNLSGIVSIQFPKGKKGVYSVSNTSSDLEQQKMIHLDQYSGKEVLRHNWEDVGFLMRGRMWVMAFHQGEFGPWNWWLMLFVAFILATMSISALVSYVLRKHKGSWGVPKVPSQFNIGYVLIGIIVLLGILFPLFGISILLLFGVELYRKATNKLKPI